MWLPQKHYKAVGAALARAREKAGLTQEELAARLSKPQSFVSNYEAGQRRIDVLELVRIAEEIGVDPARIFDTIVAGLKPRNWWRWRKD